MLLRPSLDLGLELHSDLILLGLRLLLLELTFPYLLNCLLLRISHVVHSLVDRRLNVGRFAPGIVGIEFDSHLLLGRCGRRGGTAIRHARRRRRAAPMDSRSGLGINLDPPLIDFVPNAVGGLLLGLILTLQTLSASFIVKGCRGRGGVLRRRAERRTGPRSSCCRMRAVKSHQIGRGLLLGRGADARDRCRGRLGSGGGTWRSRSSSPLRSRRRRTWLSRSLTNGSPLGNAPTSSSTTDAVKHPANLGKLEGNEAHARSMIMAGTAPVMMVHSASDLVHGLPERLERAGRGLGHVIGGTSAGGAAAAAAAAAAATAAPMEHGRQLGHRGLLHGKLGILILNIPPAVGQDLGTAAAVRRRLLVNTNAPVISIGTVGIDVVQSQAMTLDCGQAKTGAAGHLEGIEEAGIFLPGVGNLVKDRDGGATAVTIHFCR
mmetsp:Transcript_25383/g.73450  ORF Transcript_25383/g.73450 Transcript_25383/m.73450 type:complete len:433 (+) Transcript_25383:426-1724(+)